MDINPFFTQILYYSGTQLHFLFIKYLCGLHEYIKFFNLGRKNIESDRRDTWRRCFRRPFHTYAYYSVCLSDLLLCISKRVFVISKIQFSDFDTGQGNEMHLKK